LFASINLLLALTYRFRALSACPFSSNFFALLTNLSASLYKSGSEELPPPSPAANRVCDNKQNEMM
jgi:hypothetical protein